MQNIGFKRYWVQSAKRVLLRTNDKARATSYVKNSKNEVFIWDCVYRQIVDKNFQIEIVK